MVHLKSPSRSADGKHSSVVFDEQTEQNCCHHDEQTCFDCTGATGHGDAESIVAGRRVGPVTGRWRQSSGASVREVGAGDGVESHGDRQTGESQRRSSRQVACALGVGYRHGCQSYDAAAGLGVGEVDFEIPVVGSDDVVIAVSAGEGDGEFDGLPASNVDDAVIGVGDCEGADGDIGNSFANEADTQGTVRGVHVAPTLAGVWHQRDADVLVDGSVATFHVGQIHGRL